MQKTLLARSTALALILAFSLGGCGGGGERLASASGSAPIPVPPPPPPPPPTTSPPAYAPRAATIFAEPLYNPDLVVVGKGWQNEFVRNTSEPARNVRDADGLSFSYDAASKTYQVSAPLVGSGRLDQVSDYANGQFGTQLLAEPSNKTPSPSMDAALTMSAPDRPGAKYSYVSFVDLYWMVPGPDLDTYAYGSFGLAQPTKAGDVPVSGTARYNGDLFGHIAGDAGATWIAGSARFDFDFARALLSGELKAGLQCMMGCSPDITTYSFADTRFVLGATSFSGRLDSPGAPSSGSFSGIFAGPNAAELVSRFEMPFFSNQTGKWMSAGGVIAAKRQ
jgi:hypothetical protein